jgi:hypothetical protein
MYSHSSGAALALHAAAHGRPVAKLVLQEPPYVPAAKRNNGPGRKSARNSRPSGRGPPWRRSRAGLDDGDAGGDGRSDAQRAVVGGDGGDGAHDRLRLRGHGPHQHGQHDSDRPTRRRDDPRPRPVRPSPRRSRSPLRSMSRGSRQRWLDRGRHCSVECEGRELPAITTGEAACGAIT